ncbi:CHAD domain-containing protein, partial [Dokdonella sp.]|uniref:CHAD domain-containing protein n=1 Tax=Dokdonella sp. TaxID=2291710 RepID=UPI003C712728
MSGSTVAPQAATAQLLDDAAQRAARLLAMELQARVRAAHARLADPADGEALHDFRVAVRRLRSWLDIEAVLPGKLVPARVRKTLHSLAKASNAWRDDEVLAEWLVARRAASAVQHDDAVDWLLARIGELRQGDVGGLHAGLDRDFGKAMASLDEHLPWYSVRRHVHRGEQEETFATSLAALLRLDVGRLQRRLAAVRARGDDKAIH